VSCTYSVFPTERFSSFAVILEMLHYQELWFRNLASSKTCSTCKFSSFAVFCNPILILHVEEEYISFLGLKHFRHDVSYKKCNVQNTYYIDENKVVTKFMTFLNHLSQRLL
jgi:hypothetical protein